MARLLLIFALSIAMELFTANAGDPDMLQDFCVATKDPNDILTASTLPGLNTMGVSMARIDYVPNGIGPPHVHPRSAEVVILLEGTLFLGFVDGNNKLFSTVINQGDVFVLPPGLVYFSSNIDKNNTAVVLVMYSGQNPDFWFVPNAVFGSRPSISVDVLSKAFRIDEKFVKDNQSKFTK